MALNSSQYNERKKCRRNKKVESLHFKVFNFLRPRKYQFEAHKAGSKHYKAVIHHKTPLLRFSGQKRLQCECETLVSSEFDHRLHFSSQKHQKTWHTEMKRSRDPKICFDLSAALEQWTNVEITNSLNYLEKKKRKNSWRNVPVQKRAKSGTIRFSKFFLLCLNQYERFEMPFWAIKRDW